MVDDNSRQHEEVAMVVDASPGARLIRMHGGGPAAARNAGAATAEGEVICFTDDDCEPDPQWARLLAARAGTAGAAAGRTLNAGPGRAAAISQAITNVLLESSLDADGRAGFAPSCNLAISRSLAAQLPFDESYPSAAGEDRQWCHRAGAFGAAPLYEPEAIVHHHQTLTLPGLLRQQLRYGRGSARFRRRGGSAPGPAFWRGIARAALRAGPAGIIVMVAAQGGVAAGAAMEAVSGLKQRLPRKTVGRSSGQARHGGGDIG